MVVNSNFNSLLGFLLPRQANLIFFAEREEKVFSANQHFPSGNGFNSFFG